MVLFDCESLNEENDLMEKCVIDWSEYKGSELPGSCCKFNIEIQISSPV